MNWSLFIHAFLLSAWKVKFRLIAMFFLTIVIAVLCAKFETPKYKTSWVVLLPGTERASTINLDNLGEARSSGKNAYGSVSISPKNTYKEIALSDAVIQQAASAYGVEAYAFSKPRIKLIDQTPAMEFTLKGTSKDELAGRAALFNDTFHDILDKLRKNEIERHYQGVEGNLSEAKKRLKEAREAILDYQSKSNIVSDEQFQIWLNNAEQLRTKQSQTEVKIASTEATLDAELSQLGVSAEQAEAFLLLQANPANRVAMELLSEKLTEHASKQKIFGKQNPKRQQLEQEIAGIRKSLAGNLRTVPLLSSIKRPQLYGLLSGEIRSSLQRANERIATLKGAKAELAALDTQQNQYTHRIKEHVAEAAQLSDLKRGHQIAEAIFSSALAKLDTSRLDIYATYPLTQLLTEPGGTIKRDRLPAKIMIVALFLVFLLISLALVLTQLRKTLQSEVETELTLADQSELSAS